MIQEMRLRPFLHERVIDCDGEFIVSVPLRFIPVVETSIAIVRDDRLELIPFEKAEAA